MALPKLKIKSLAQIKSLRQYKTKNFIKPEELEKDIIASLTKIGERLIQEAYLSKSYQNRTGNLHDSYVSGVFKNGVLVKGSDRYLSDLVDTNGNVHRTPSVEIGDTMSGDTEYTSGREEAKRFLAKWPFSQGRPSGIVLVIAAAMYYSGILESREFRVISHIRGDLEELARHGITTMKYNAHIDESYIDEPSIIREGGSGRMGVINV